MMQYTEPHYYYLIPKEQFVKVIGFKLSGETRLGNVRLLLHYSILSVVYQASLNYFLLEDFMNDCVNLQYIREHCPEELL